MLLAVRPHRPGGVAQLTMETVSESGPSNPLDYGRDTARSRLEGLGTPPEGRVHPLGHHHRPPRHQHRRLLHRRHRGRQPMTRSTVTPPVLLTLVLAACDSGSSTSTTTTPSPRRRRRSRRITEPCRRPARPARPPLRPLRRTSTSTTTTTTVPLPPFPGQEELEAARALWASHGLDRGPVCGGGRGRLGRPGPF